jgi:hypothetical protein
MAKANYLGLVFAVGMTHTSCSASLSDKPPARRFVTDQSSAHNFQCHGTLKIDINRFVSDSHGTATQLKWPTVSAGQDLVMFELKLGRRKN